MDFLTSNILTRGVWGDEAWTALISQLPWLDLVKTTADDFHPPLYYSIIHFWIQVFGSGEVVIRLVSVLFWLLSGAVIYLFARSLRFSSFWSIVCGFFVLFNPFVFQYAFEARNYTLFVFLSTLSMWRFYEIAKSRRTETETARKSVLYLLPTVLGLYTHYYMFFVVAAQYFFVLIFRRDLWKKFFLFSLLFFLLYLPWLPFFFSQAKSVAGGYWISPISLDTVVGGALVLFLGEQKTLLTYFLAAVFLGYLVEAWIVAGKEKRQKTWETGLFAIWLVVPFVIPIVISLIRPIFFYRYLVFLSVPLMLGPLYWLSNGKKPGRAVLGPLLVLIIYVLLDLINFFSSTDQHFKPVLAQIHREAKSGDVIYTVLPSFAEVVYYNDYDGHPLEVRVLPVGLAQASGKALLDIYAQKKYLALENFPIFGRYWYLEPGPKYQLVISH